MDELRHFYKLKELILVAYQKSYPYFQGDWRNFSSKDIRQLIDLIEVQQKEKVSEKWIYSHLKPESNQKLPRKDMLDIFSSFCGFTDWDEFVFKNKSENKTGFNENQVKKKPKRLYVLLLIPIFGLAVYFLTKVKTESKLLEIKNEFTSEPVSDNEIQVYEVGNEKKIPVKVENSKIELNSKNEKIVIESPYYETKEVELSDSVNEVLIKPADYAMVLKNFILSDLKNWEDRRVKLDKILSDDLEVIVLLKNDLGAEYLNKQEFAGKLIVPTSETKKMKILNLETNQGKKISFIRIQQL